MKEGLKYSLITFILWIAALAILAFLAVFNNFLLNPSFLYGLLIPALVFSVFSYGISKIKDKSVKRGVFFALVGAIIWASPALYFFPSSKLYSVLSPLLKFLVIIGPTTILSLIFFVLGRTESQNLDNMSELYVMHNRFSK